MLCGVVSGAVMGLGILLGRDSGEGRVEPSFDAARDFVKAFQSRFGALDCLALTGLDLSSAAQRKLMAIGGVKEKKCALFLDWALEEISRFLPGASAAGDRRG